MNGTVGTEVAKVLLIETNFSFNKFDTAKASVFNLFSLSANMKLRFFFCLPISRLNSLKKRFGELKIVKVDHHSVLVSSIAGVSLVSVKREILPDYAFLYSFIKPSLIRFCMLSLFLKVKTLTAVVSASARLSGALSTSCSKFDSSRQCLK